MLLDRDRFLTACTAGPEFQKKMTGAGTLSPLAPVAEQEDGKQGSRRACSPPAAASPSRFWSGLRPTAAVFLNAVKLWAMKRQGLIPEHGFDLDLKPKSSRSVTYHRWGLFEHGQALATLILGGGVPKNYNLARAGAVADRLGLPGPRLCSTYRLSAHR